jgi:hypothetical protein
MTKRISAIILIACLLACLIFLTGCEVVSEIPISVEYIPAYDAMETQYEYKYDMWHGDFVMLPVLKMVHHEEQYKVQYEITYSDGYKTTDTRTVDKATYEEAKRAIAERGEG